MAAEVIVSMVILYGLWVVLGGYACRVIYKEGKKNRIVPELSASNAIERDQMRSVAPSNEPVSRPDQGLKKKQKKRFLSRFRKNPVNYNKFTDIIR